MCWPRLRHLLLKLLVLHLGLLVHPYFHYRREALTGCHLQVKIRHGRVTTENYARSLIHIS